MNRADVTVASCAAVENVLARLRAQHDELYTPAVAVQGLKKRPWVLAFGFDDTLIADRRDLRRAELDSACPHLPCHVFHLSLHRIYFNTAAMEVRVFERGSR